MENTNQQTSNVDGDDKLKQVLFLVPTNPGMILKHYLNLKPLTLQKLECQN